MTSGTRLFVGNLPDNTAESDLRDAFSSYGEIISLDLKNKTATDDNQKKFAFITLKASNYDVEACIKNFTNDVFKGNMLYVTRARESFLERLQREREQGNKKEIEKNDHTESLPKKNPVLKLGDKLNPRKRKVDEINVQKPINNNKTFNINKEHTFSNSYNNNVHMKPFSETDKKKLDSEKKRLESMKKKRMEFKEKQNIIKSGLIGIDKIQNKKKVFSDDEDDSTHKKEINLINHESQSKRNTLFDEEDSDNEINFEIKNQFEGKKGQKVLDLQSRYKSDKRFVLDERFTEDNEEADEEQENVKNGDEIVELGQSDEKMKQLNILQDVLGVSIKSNVNDSEKQRNKPKPKHGMLRFDPTQPEHSKFFAPVEEKQELTKKSKKKKEIVVEEKKPETVQQDVEKVEVSKEQFYTVSEKLKEAIVQPSNTFSLRSLFAKNDDDNEKEPKEQETDYIPLKPPKEPKVRNPLNPIEKNPFVYDSSDSENEEQNIKVENDKTLSNTDHRPAIWKENLFFSKNDIRLKEGLEFFSKINSNGGQKERRELKSLMKKRIYNKERKNQMFQKKIGGRKKSMKKSFRKQR